MAQATEMGSPAGEPIVAAEHLDVTFPSDAGDGRVVRDVSFAIHPGERVGLVGESGSGKSLTARAIMRLIPKPGTATGRILLRGTELGVGDTKTPSSWRGTVLSMITQDPLSSLNPMMRIGPQIRETLRFHEHLKRGAADARAAALLSAVGIPDPPRALRSYPAALSGGMRQRVALAIAVSCNPELLIADEPTTALDVTIQVQVLALLEQMTAERGSAVLLISHDLAVVAGFCDRLLVMYAGRIVESGPTETLITHPSHPYTRALMRSVVPVTGELPSRLASIPGSPPVGGLVGKGCAFAPRCPIARPICFQHEPELRLLGRDAHHAACHAASDPSWLDSKPQPSAGARP